MNQTTRYPDPDWLFSTNEDEEKTFDYQVNLPSLPVPELGKTLDRYLDSVKPYLTDQEYRKTEYIVQQFANGVGRDLHRKLLLRAEKSRNWLEQWWEDKAYLELRFPLSPFSNMGGLTLYSPKEGSQVERAAFTLHYLTKYWKLLRTQRLRADSNRKGDKLCMSQYRHAFSTCRVPGVFKDSLYTYFKTEDEGPSPSHIMVFHKGRIFCVSVVDNNEDPLTPPELQIQLQMIKDMCKNAPKGQELCTLTSCDRTTFAQLRSRLLAFHPDNFHNLELIQQSLFGFTLDDASPQTESEAVKLALAGDLTNRWSDKSSNIIVFENGVVANQSDHAPLDGMVVIASLYYVDLQFIKSKGKWQGTTKVRDLPKPREFIFHIDDEIRQAVVNTKEMFFANASNLAAKIAHFKTYGKKFLRKCRLHPDTYVQMVLQYTYYRQYEMSPPTYETATTRSYFHGRTETIRTCTMETVEFCKTMCEITSSIKSKRAAYLKAANKHATLMEEATQMKGCDRHLLGLSIIAQEEGIPTPLLYQDEAFTKSGGGGNFVLSTSSMGNTSVMGCVTPMVDDGYGFFYQIKQDEIVFFITSWKSSKMTDADKFAALLNQCLEDMLPIISLSFVKL